MGVDSWDRWERRAERGPFHFGVRVFVALVLFGMFATVGACVLGVFGTAVGVVTETATVAREEFGPRASLEKYEWFKSAAASLDKKRADVGVYEARRANQAEMYGADARQWPRDVREQSAIWSSEVAGIKASYNQLASEYNAQMAKFNWAYAEVGRLPPGASMPLPREYKPYLEN